MAWGALATDDPIFFFHYISSDHAQLAATALARYGVTLSRVRQVGIWSLSFVAAMTPPLALAAAVVAGACGRDAVEAPATPAMRVVLVAGLAPVVLYLVQGLVRLGFEPLPRFAVVPGTLLLPFAAMALPARRMPAARVAVPLLGATFAVLIFVIAGWGRSRLWGGAESMGALTRRDAADRALADYLRAARAPGERVMIEPLAFAEIAIAAAGGVPQTDVVTLSITREPAATVAETMRVTGARWMAARADDRPSTWTTRLPDWPADALELGRWRLIHR